VSGDASLTALEDWAAGLLHAVSPAGKRRIARGVAIGLRASQRRRIAEQRNPDGTPYAPRKPRLRSKAGRIKRGAMFAKLRTARYLKAHADATGAVVEITGNAARIARVHQYGLIDKVAPSGPNTRYPRRLLLGFAADDRDLVRDLILGQLNG
jgi:phage virion morphogenesis protein